MGTIDSLLASHVSFRCTSADRVGIGGSDATSLVLLAFGPGHPPRDHTPRGGDYELLLARWCAEVAWR